METQYRRIYSPALGRDMELKLYGHAGRPVLYVPCQDGRFYDFENFKMTDAWAPWLERGLVTVCAVDTLDRETWSDQGGDPAWRIRRHEQWMDHLFHEVAPMLLWERPAEQGIIAFGCSLGATHAANLFFRRPDLFGGCLCLSGVYDSDFFFDGYMDETLYMNSPERYMPSLDPGHYYVDLYNQRKIIVCIGQGAWEDGLGSQRFLDTVFKEKGIQAWFDYWGYDVNHDWPWWKLQMRYFLPYLLGDM